MTRSRLAARIEMVMRQSAIATIVVLPLFYCETGRDVFRLPKELLFRAETILLLSLTILRLIVEPAVPWRSAARDRVLQLAAAAALWVSISAIAAPNHAVSFPAWGRALSLIFFFAVAYVTGRETSSGSLGIALTGSVATAILAMLQALDLWSPVTLDASTRRMETAALVGNANDVGMVLVPAAIICLGHIRESRGGRRAFFTTVLLVMIGGIAASQTLTAMVALLAGIAVVLLRNRRVAVIALPAILVTGALVITVFPPVAVRVFDAAAWLKRGDYDRILSGRSIAFFSAARMARDHPILGVGPGGFAWNYFDYAIDVRRIHPSLAASMTGGVNFAEAHNDHLQLIAEYGVIGYAIFAGLLVVWIRRTRRSPVGFVSFIGIPFAVSLMLLMAAQFPLYLVTAAATWAYFGATLLRWSTA